MAWERLRTIVEELDVSEQLDLYREKYPRFEEIWDGLTWLLARNPDLPGSATWVGDDGKASNYRAYALRGDELADTPDVWVVYAYTETEVIILGVQARDRTPTAE